MKLIEQITYFSERKNPYNYLRVFRKTSGDKVMLHKFLLWKTNKEQTGRYPAYIIYHTDFSSGRKDMIKRDMLYSNDEKQIRELLAAEIADNVKKGWEEI